MRITEFAKGCGVTAHALRHYERLGLLLPTRLESGYRDYTDAMRRELVFITMSRKVGFSLDEIALQIPAFRVGRLSTEQMVDFLRARLTAIEQQQALLAAQRNEVLSHIVWLQAQKRSLATRSPIRPNRKKAAP
jgi:DNA-binding transcriptional MerR regulator